MRAFIAAVVCLLLACSRGDDATVLTISGSAVGKEGEVLTRQIRRFMAAHPGLTVRIHETPDDATQRHQLYVQWLNARVGSPDVLQLDVVWTAEFAAAGWILPLDRFRPDGRDFFPAALDACRWRGSLFAVPWFVDVGMLYWRTDLLDRAPRTLDELNAAASATMQRERIPAGIVWQGARYEGLVTVFNEILGAHGGTILNPDGRVAVHSEAGVRALTFLRDQVRRGIAPREVLTWHEEECRFAFQNGNALFMRNWPYAVAAMSEKSESRVAGRFGVAPMPAATGSRPTSTPGRPTATLGGAPLAINAWSRQPERAWQLVAFLTAPEQMLERAQIVGQYPARLSVYGDAALAAALPVAPEEVRRIIEAAVARPATPVWAELSSELQVGLHRALTGAAEPRAALTEAASRMQRLLDESGLSAKGAARP
ncbi:MAG TPA: ABC transporter substrate-binding protein [Thermoanaerobaculia bacterium]|nr:ABC transporter substrate-binding protein [Thermoanaerobaculia bacterium]